VYVDGLLKTTQGPVSFSGLLSGDAYISSIYFEAGCNDGGYLPKTIWTDDIQISRDTSLHVKYAGSTNMARAKSPMYTVGTTTQYSVAFDFYIPSASSSNLVVLFDDLQVELRWKSNKWVYAVDANSKENPVGTATTDTWNRITIDVRPGTGYYVSLNSVAYGAHEDHGPYSLRTGYSGSNYYMYFGSKATPTSKEAGDAYWDNILLGIYCAY
jgi:hypothetical protein